MNNEIYIEGINRPVPKNHEAMAREWIRLGKPAVELKDLYDKWVNAEPDWNMEYRQQVLERIGPVRQKQAGLDRPVFIHNILTKDTVDELVLERLETKRETQDILLDAMKQKGFRK